MTAEIRPYQAGDFDRVAQLRSEAFRRPTSNDDWLRDGLVLVDGGRVVAALRLCRYEQVFGGRRLPSAMVTAVMVAAEARGRGHGTALLRHAIAEMRGRDVAISTLYPSTMDVYRRLGYEIAGARIYYRCPLWALPSKGPLAVVSWDDHDLDAVRDCYERFANASSGLMLRTRDWWQRVTLAPATEGGVQRYLVRDGGEVTGYVIYTQQPVTTKDPTDHGYYFTLACRDLVWTSRDSALSLLAFLAGSRAFASDMTWYGAIDDPLPTLFEREAMEIAHTARWMARIVKLDRALEGRGYPAAIEASLELTVQDSVARQSRSIRVEIAGGAASVSDVPRAAAEIDVGALTALYTGSTSARDLQRLGRFNHALPDQVEVANAMFAGPCPWLAEVF